MYLYCCQCKVSIAMLFASHVASVIRVCLPGRGHGKLARVFRLQADPQNLKRPTFVNPELETLKRKLRGPKPKARNRADWLR